MKVSSLPVLKNTKYYITKKMDDGYYWVLSREDDYILTKSRTFERASNHIHKCTGKYPRCCHEWARVRIFANHWKTGEKVNTGCEEIDALKCVICDVFKKMERAIDRNRPRRVSKGRVRNHHRTRKGVSVFKKSEKPE